MDFILRCLPQDLADLIRRHNIQKIEEIRIRCGKQVILNMGSIEIALKHVASTADIIKILQNMCNNSVYAYQSQITNGFITLQGGHRVGLAGNVVSDADGNVTNISHVYSMNIRIAHEIDGASNEILRFVLDTKNNTIFNTLIASPPGCGKTTIIRDLAKKISNGIPEINFRGIDVCVIDERGEIAAMTKGQANNDLGTRTDIIDNVSKSIGIRMAVRAMAPKVIVADEIGNAQDADIANYAICSGVSCLFTAHGSCMDDLLRNREINRLINLKLFSKVIFLDEKVKGRAKQIINV